VCRYNWHSAGSLGWPFPVLKYGCVFQTKLTIAILSDSTRKLLLLEIRKMRMIAVLKNMNLLCYFARDLVMDETGGWLVMRRMSAFLTKVVPTNVQDSS